MAFFKFRKGEGDSVAPPAQPESVEAMRKRARQRLIGAAVLVLAGVIGFPLVFDTQPRPVSLDIPIEIPDRNRVAPVTPPPAPAAAPVVGSGALPAATPPAHAAPGTEPNAAAPAAPAPVSPATRAEAPVTPPPAPPVQARAEAKAAPEPKPPAPPEAARHASSDDGARARALLEGRAPATAAPPQSKAPPGGERFVVQVGAFAEAGKAREVRARLERAGIKTYVHVAQTAEGPRIRVRVGPFNSRAEVEKAAQKIKGLDLPAAILTL